MPSNRRPAGSSTRSRSPRPIQGHVLTDDRLERRLGRLRWRRVVTSLAIIGVVAGLVATYFSPLLRVQEIQIAGTDNVDAALATQLADLGGQSMFRLDLSETEARIEALPLVKSAVAQRSWPNTVRIRISERLPWGYWRSGGTTYVIDAEGVVLPHQTTLLPDEGAPLIDDMSGAGLLRQGDRVDGDVVALVRATLERAQATFGIGTLEYTPEVGLSLTTESGYRVILGDSQNADFKLAVWQAMEQELGREALVGRTLDLRFQDRPSLR